MALKVNGVIVNKGIRNPSKRTIAAVMELVKGRGGIDDESFVHDFGWEEHENIVSVCCSHGSRAYRILKRVGSKVKKLRVNTGSSGEFHSIDLEIDRGVFRGLEYCFQQVDNKSTVSTEDQND